MSRSNIALQVAPGSALLRQLPHTSAEGPFYRAHQKHPGRSRGCWWFAGTQNAAIPEGRFDLPLPRGTLYLAQTPLAAALESCGRYLAYGSPIPLSAVEGRVVSTIAGSLTDLGDVTHQLAVKVGVTREINTLSDYLVTTTWSIGADSVGYKGLQYSPRFSTDDSRAYALFGTAGASPPAGLSIVSVAALGQVLHDAGFAPRKLPSQEQLVDDGANPELR